MATTIAPSPSQENIGRDRPELPHRNSSTKHVPEQQQSQLPHQPRQPVQQEQQPAQQQQQQQEPALPRTSTTTVPRAPHRGEGHGESKPAPREGHGAHPGTDKVDLDGPPQPDWERAEAERKERAQQAEQAAKEGREGADYPEQLHAGEVGLGPAFADHTRATFGDKVAGFKDVLASKVKKNPELAQAGHDRMTGEAKRREFQHQNETDPFKKADADNKPKQPDAPKTEDAPAQAGSAPADKPPQEPSNVPTTQTQGPPGSRNVGFAETGKETA